MANRPSVLVLDDGELDNFHEMLVKLGADVVRLKGGEIGVSVPAPKDLLITAGRRTLTNMPRLAFDGGGSKTPTWVCVHNQDFLPMRERLAQMGVHFLLQNALDEQSRRRFLIQLLRPGVEKRRGMRLPLGSDVVYRSKLGADETGTIIDLSVDGCRLLTQEPFEAGFPLVAFLPASLGGGDELTLTGKVLRDSVHEIRSGRDVYCTVIQFEGIDDATRKQLVSISRGQQIGTQITPLAARPNAAGEAVGEASGRAGTDRRGKDRRGYTRPVQVLGPQASEADAVFGRDLSTGGIRLTGCPALEERTRVTVALFGAAREEPIVLDASVVRVSTDGETALSFEAMSPTQRAALEKLLRSQPVLDALERPDSDSGRTVVAEVRVAASA